MAIVKPKILGIKAVRKAEIILCIGKSMWFALQGNVHFFRS